MSVLVILLAVIAVVLSAVPLSAGTNVNRRTRRDRRPKALTVLEAPVDQQLPCNGESMGEGRGLGAGRGQGFSNCDSVSQGRGAGRGNRMVGRGAGRGRGQGRSYASNFGWRNQGGCR